MEINGLASSDAGDEVDPRRNTYFEFKPHFLPNNQSNRFSSNRFSASPESPYRNGMKLT